MKKQLLSLVLNWINTFGLCLFKPCQDSTAIVLKGALLWEWESQPVMRFLRTVTSPNASGEKEFLSMVILVYVFSILN
ncbi:hypothetical protein [Lacinutrix sp. Hel_I_90]|uniref:hypothetical protein n=1 Tax=Lacinutrix sp. Hel_I_90 TaxID=1249999 RepID=UPI0012E01E73|nr:hypothetical protein [Lacinutrix sp. Hel_I_90]